MLWHRLFTDPLSWRPLLMGLIPAMVLAWLAARVARRVLYRTLATLLQESLTPSSPFIRAPLRLMSAAVFVLVFSVLIVPALEIAGMHPRGGVHLRSLSEWAFDSGLRVLLVIAFAYALIRGVGLGVKRFETDVNFGTGLDALERARRARTLGAVLSNVTSIVVVAIATLMVLHELRVDISPALTGTAVVGVALGFGAQTLVKDLIGGFFLILENQVRVGDVASINGTGGLVEAINLRTIVLRDEQGTVHVIPNGSIETLANLTKDFSYYVINLPLAYGEDPDAVGALAKQVADGLQREPAFQAFILAPLEIVGLDAFEENAVRLKMRIKTAPLKQWTVGRELRRRLNHALQERGIQMWSPQRTMVVKD